MRLAIPTLILAVILVLGWRVCSGGETDHLRLTEDDLPVELRQGYQAVVKSADDPAEPVEPSADEADRAVGTAQKTLAALAQSGDETAAMPKQTLGEAEEAAAAPKISVPALPAVSATKTGSPVELTPAPTIVVAPKPPATPRKAADPAQVATPASERLYVVQPGDWLHQIAREQYGDAARATDIAQANALLNPNTLRPGQKLVLP